MSISVSIPDSSQVKHLLDYEEAAAWLGIKPQSLRRWVSEHRVPFIKLGRRAVRFDVDVLQSWIDSQSISAKGGQR